MSVERSVGTAAGTGGHEPGVAAGELGNSRRPDQLPILREVDDAVILAARRSSETPTSCTAGCAACCRQLVPVAPVEAQALVELLHGLEAGHRRRVLARFEAALERLEDAELLEELDDVARSTRAERARLALRYFELSLACPFLEDERCSIYDERPLACREYLVTSPAPECERLGKITRLQIQGRVLPRLLRAPGAEAWMPMVLIGTWLEQRGP